MQTESQHIEHYELQQCLGQNNANETWRAYDNSAKRTVILKLYRTDVPAGAHSLTNHLADIEQIASLHHPNLARIYDIQLLASNKNGNSGPMICLATEYVEGGTLADYIKGIAHSGKMPASAEIVQLFSALALAIDSAHQRGIVHGNLKPTNILFNQAAAREGRLGTPIITDFGRVKSLAKKNGNDVPFYLAPEQMKSASATRRSDIYALGVLLYELYTGMPPFRGHRPIAVMMQHMNALPTPPDLVNPGISGALAQVIMRCLSKDPQERFPNATSLTIALASALHIPVPANLRHFALQLGSDVQVESVPGVVRDTGHMPGASKVSKPDLSLSVRRKGQPRLLIAISLVTLVVILGASFGAMQFAQRHSTTIAGATSVVGHAFFLNSGQLNENTTQGINDELQIDVSHLPDPASGKSYYAWLLGDSSQTETAPLLLGHLTMTRGSAHFLYTGDGQHTNLLTFASRLLINEDDASQPASDPLLNQSAWRYYAIIPQTPDSADKLHFSMLDHLRHLLVESPELAIRGLHGGLAFWFARNALAISGAAEGLARDWQNKDTNTLRSQTIRILDYLDGSVYIKPDVPAGTPFLADTQAAQVALLGPSPQDVYAPGYVYQNEPPPGYIYLLQTHLNGALLAPQATTDQHRLAVQISGGIDHARRALTSVYQDAKQLLRMSDAQLLQASALTLLDDMATQAQYASTGQPDPSTGIAQGGALWIYDNLQRLATFVVQPYAAGSKL